MSQNPFYHLFRILDQELGPDINMSQWLADVWQCNVRSAYRRIKGETKVSFMDWLQVVAARPQAAMLQSELFKVGKLRIFSPQYINNEEALVEQLLLGVAERLLAPAERGV